jgi:hypothetical protein
MSNDDDYDYFSMSVRDSLALIFWTSFFTLCFVGTILAVAL